MSKMSRSPERHTFQKNCHIKRQKEKGESVLQEYVDLFDSLVEDDKQKDHDTKWQKNNLEYDLRTTDWILDKVRSKESYAQNLYAAMCNNDFQKLEVVPILKEEQWGCSWRYAGGIIADMREEGDYIDWYCSGIQGGWPDDSVLSKLTPEELARLEESKNFVAEGHVTDEIREDLKKLGWTVISDQP
jgi:hypothetical protein